MKPNAKLISATDDLELLARQINSASWSPENEMDDDEFTAASLNLYLADQSNVLVVAYIENRFAGLASGSIREKPYPNSRWLYVDEVDVTADYRRQGVGKAMMNTLLRLATEQSCCELWLGTEHDNSAAQALYNSLKPLEVESFVGFTYKLR